jgi:hypothetical protein
MMQRTLLLMVLAVGAGCAGGEADAVSAASSAYAAHAEPLARISRTIWSNAPAGCEGRLGDSDVRWGVAIEAPELIVALLNDVAVCVDTYSAVESELGTIDSPQLDGLWAGYVATLQELEPNLGEAAPEIGELEPYEADPHPQPSRELTPIVSPAADLGLELRLDLLRAEPHPQPSEPNPSASGSTSGSSGASTSSASGDTTVTTPSMGTPAPREEPSRT